MTLRGGSELSALALDTDIPPTALGGPVVNGQGDVLGVVTRQAQPESRDGDDRAFAIPVDVAKETTFAILDARD